jgi:hypothetical protein
VQQDAEMQYYNSGKFDIAKTKCLVDLGLAPYSLVPLRVCVVSRMDWNVNVLLTALNRLTTVTQAWSSHKIRSTA